MGYRTVSYLDTRAHVHFRFRSLEVFERAHLDECTRANLSLAAVEFQPPFIDLATIRRKLYKYICPFRVGDRVAYSLPVSPPTLPWIRLSFLALCCSSVCWHGCVQGVHCDP